MKWTPWHIMVAILLIAVFFSIVGLVGYLLYGPKLNIVVPNFIMNYGMGTSTPNASEVPAQEVAQENTSSVEENQIAVTEFLSQQAGALFICEAGKALKAEFSEGNVRLAFSDGRVVNLPHIVTTGGELQYANADETFLFRNVGEIVFLEEGGVVTYTGCKTP